MSCTAKAIQHVIAQWERAGRTALRKVVMNWQSADVVSFTQFRSKRWLARNTRPMPVPPKDVA